MNTPNDGFYYPNGNNSMKGNGSDGNGFAGPGMSTPPAQPLAARPAPSPVDIARMQRMSLDGEEKSKVNILDYLWLLWRGKWIILTCLLIAGLGTAYYTFSLPFVYQSRLTLTVNDQDETKSSVLGGWTYSNPARTLQRELQVMTSRPVMERTATAILDRRYLDTTGVLKDSVIPIIVAAENALKLALKGATPEQKQAKLTSYVAGVVQRMTNAAPAKDADIIQVVSTAGDPQEAALIANIYAQVYQDENKTRNREKTRSTMNYLSNRVASVQDSLRVKEDELRNFMMNNGVFTQDVAAGLAANKNQLEDNASKIRIQIATLTNQRDEYVKRVKEVEPTYSAEMAAATSLVITQMQQEIAQLQVKRQMMEVDNPPRASEVWYQKMRTDLERQIQELTSKLDVKVSEYKNSNLGKVPSLSTVSGSNSIGVLNGLKQQVVDNDMQIQALRAQLSATEGAMREVDAKISRVPDLTLQLGRITRDKGSLEKIYMQLNDDFNKKAIEVESLFSSARIIEPAQPNFGPISPNRSGNITTGSILGLAVGIGIVLLIAYTDSTVHSPDELEKNGFIVLSAIPLITEAALEAASQQLSTLSESFTGKPAPHIITQLDPKSPIAESYRSLRTAVQYSSVENQVRTLLVTSSIPQEGKSTTSTNLAVVIAQSGARTLLIDCDLRRPVLHSVFGMSKEPGLVNTLVGAVPLDEAIHPSGIPNLDLLPSGSIPPNPSELLGSRRMRSLLEELKGRYDTVVLDSPPVGTVTDSVVLSTLVDATLIIVRAHKTKMEFLEKTREALERISSNLLGIVLNDFDVSQSYGSTYRYYRYYKYYGYYSHDEGSSDGSQRKTEKKTSEKEKVAA